MKHNLSVTYVSNLLLFSAHGHCGCLTCQVQCCVYKRDIKLVILIPDESVGTALTGKAGLLINYCIVNQSYRNMFLFVGTILQHHFYNGRYGGLSWKFIVNNNLYSEIALQEHYCEDIQ